MLLGNVQLTTPSDAFPELRIRFTPPAGLVYGPSNLIERVDAIKARFPDTQWKELSLARERLFLNPEATWCKFNPQIKGDFRTNPGLLYAFDDHEESPEFMTSLGLIDDISDGLIHCSVQGLTATARIVVGPPDYAPDRRPIVSLADGLKDRVDRDSVLEDAYVENLELTSLEIADMMERILETMELINLDAHNDRSRLTNRSIANNSGLPPVAGENKVFPRIESVGGRPLPLTDYGRQRHRRFLSLEVFEDILRERPDLIERIIREPMTGEPYYDRRMPALMRGSDSFPLHVTRRQYDFLTRWARRLRRDSEG